MPPVANPREDPGSPAPSRSEGGPCCHGLHFLRVRIPGPCRHFRVWIGAYGIIADNNWGGALDLSKPGLRVLMVKLRHGELKNIP